MHFLKILACCMQGFQIKFVKINHVAAQKTNETFGCDPFLALNVRCGRGVCARVHAARRGDTEQRDTVCPSF